MIGFIFANKNEILISEKNIVIKGIKKHGSIVIAIGKIFGVDGVLACSGVGKVNAAITSQLLITEYKVKILINIGYAATIVDYISRGDIVLSTSCIQHDFDATAFGYSYGQIPCFATAVIESSIKETILRDIIEPNVKVGIVLSGDVFINNAREFTVLKRKFNGQCVDMEGAAVAHCASVNNVPYILVKCISDSADYGAVSDYQDFNVKIDKVLKKLVNVVCAQYLNLSQKI